MVVWVKQFVSGEVIHNLLIHSILHKFSNLNQVGHRSVVLGLHLVIFFVQGADYLWFPLPGENP